ncbi:MAG: cell envelope integrity protein CreD [Planctomycetaceae bacterium]|nr:cell envelope integrity protein CreD [Planctomycetaceae bacterium]
MFKRIAAITFIFICTSIAWIILSITVLDRTHTQDRKLRESISKIWGSQHLQSAPVLYNDNPASSSANKLPIESSDINVNLNLEHRQKGLLWYSTYKVKFTGKYKITNDADQTKTLYFDFPLPAQNAVYDNFKFAIGGDELKEISFNNNSLTKEIKIESHQAKEVEISYESQGLDKWYYDFGNNVTQINNFTLALNTDFKNIDFPDDTMAPEIKEPTDNGWKLVWKYDKTLTDVKIGLTMPEKLNPGPWVAKVTTAAPISLFLYFFVLFVLTTVKKITIHPMNYFFIGTAFFSFHLLLAYLIDHISILCAFWISSAVAVFLVISYMRLVVGLKFAFVEIAITQLVYLIFFSYSFFFKGYTGLMITILCICTLFIVMQFTGRVDWGKLFEKQQPPPLPK